MGEENLEPLPGMEPTVIEQEFKQPTEQKEPGASPAATTSSITDADFEELPPNKTEVPAKEQVAPGKSTKANAADTADFTVDAIDASLVLSFGYVNKRKMRNYFGDRLREAKELYHDMKDGIKKKDDLTAEQLKDYRVIKHFMDIESDIPLDDDEFDKLKKRFEKYYQSRPEVDIPPGLALMITALPMLSKRLADAFDKP